MRSIIHDYVVLEAPAGQFGNVGTVKNTTNDTTANYLASKLVAGAGIALTTLNGGGNETLSVTAGVGGGTLTLKAGAFNIAAADVGKTFVITGGTFNIGVASSLALGANFACTIINIGTGVITVTPNLGNTDKLIIPGGALAGDASITLPYSGAATGPYNVSGIQILADGLNPGTLYALTTRETHGCQIFSANGNFTVPQGVTTVWLTGVGGGASGGGVALNTFNAGGGGGSGFAGYRIPITVVPGAVIAVGIGAGGLPGAAGANAGNAGSNTTFGALKTFNGGNPGGAPGANFGLGGASGVNAGTYAGGGYQAFSNGTFSQLPHGGCAPYFNGSTLHNDTFINASGASQVGQGALHPGQGGDGATAGGAGSIDQTGGGGAAGMLIVEW